MNWRGTPVMALRGVTKQYPQVVAIDDVTIEIFAGEIHCVLGENGAGKSTLISVLTGLQRPSDGHVELSGIEVNLKSPAAARAQAIQVVQQHSTLIEEFTVLENLMLAQQRRGFWLRPTQVREQFVRAAEPLGITFGADALVSVLTLAERQQLQVAQATLQQPRVLVLDEPTALLSENEAHALISTLRRLAASGVAIVLVSHKLGEVLELADSYTVLRGGRVMLSASVVELQRRWGESLRSRLLDAMFGVGAPLEDAHDERLPLSLETERQNLVGASVLSLTNACTAADEDGSALEGVSLSVAAGETLGVTGIEGPGQRQLAELIAGQRELRSGQLEFEGTDIARLPVQARWKRGIRYVTADRIHEGSIAEFSVSRNLLLKQVGAKPYWRLGFPRRNVSNSRVSQMIEAFDIRVPAPETHASALSGGNLQKLLLARELGHDPRLVVFHNPTHGLDLRTVQSVRARITGLARAGVATVLISSDLDEVLTLSDRIAVMDHGRVVKLIDNRDPHRREMVRAEVAKAMTRSSAA